MAAWIAECGCRFVFQGPADSVPGRLEDYQPLNAAQVTANGHHPDTGGTTFCVFHAAMDAAEAMKHAHLEIEVMKNRWVHQVQRRAKTLYPNRMVSAVSEDGEERSYAEDDEGYLRRLSQEEVEARIAAKTMGYGMTLEGKLEIYLPDMSVEDKAALEAAVADDEMVKAIKLARPNVRTNVMTLSTKLALDAAIKG